MPLSRIQSESMNLGDDFAFTGTVTGVGGTLKALTYVPINPVRLSGGTASFPYDNTIPLITEAAQVLQHTYTPAETTSTIFVRAEMFIAETSNVSNTQQAALFFNDTCVNARSLQGALGGAGGGRWLIIAAEFSNTDGSDLDIEIRGMNVGDNHTVNGQHLSPTQSNYTDGSSSFGGTNEVNRTYMTISEI